MSSASLATAHSNVPEFIKSAKARLRCILDRLKWTECGLLKQHRSTNVPAQLKTAAELPVSCVDSSEHSLQFDAATLRRLLGTVEKVVTFDDLQAKYTAAQKLSLYEYTIKHTKQANTSCTAENNSVFAELVAETKREQKKQRRHRKSKPTLHEELHQLVELQMQALIKHKKVEAVQQSAHSQSRVHHSHRRQRSRSPGHEHNKYLHKRSKLNEHHYPHNRDRPRSNSKHRRCSRSPVAKESRSHKKY